MKHWILFLSFFHKNPLLAEWELKNHFWGHIFPYINGSIGLIVSKNIYEVSRGCQNSQLEIVL